jgi:AraC-like DNA-binding protein
MEIIAWLGFSQGLFAAVLMFTKNERGVSDKILTGWLSLLAIEFMLCIIDYRFFGRPILSSSFLLFNPAFYLYVQSLINPAFRLKWIQLVHLFPYLFFKIFAYLVQQPYELNAYFVPNTTLWFRISFAIATVLSWVLYNSVIASTVLKHRHSLENEFSTIENYLKIGWLFFIIVFYNLYCLALVVIGILVVFHKIEVVPIQLFNYSILLALIYILSFYGLKQKRLFRFMSALPPPDERYRNTGLAADKKESIKTLLISYFDNEKPYLNPELNMNMLADALSVPKHQLTEVLNADLGKNFFRFVNEYRVEAVKKKLKHNKRNYSVEVIGYECGFNSKSTFYTVFKQITGMTPAEFGNSIQKTD